MPPDHLVGDAAGYVAELEVTGLLCHPRMVDNLQKQVAQLVAKVLMRPARDRVGDLVGLLDRVGRDCLERLLDVPGTASFGIAQAAHDVEKSRHFPGRRIRLFGHCSASAAI